MDPTTTATFRNIPQSARDKMDKGDFAGSGSSFPIEKPEDVTAAVHSLGRTNQNRDKIKSRIIAIAYRKGAEYVAKLPDDWKRTSDRKASMSGTPATFTLEPTGRYERDGYAHYPNATVLRAGEWTSGEGITVSWSTEDLHAVASVNRDPIPGDLEHVFARNPSVMTGNLSALRGTLGDLSNLRVADDGQHLLGHITVPLLLDPKLPGKGVSVEVDPADPNTLVGYTLTTDPVIQDAVLMSTLAAFAGARHSKTDQAAIQQIHNIAADQGANCTYEGKAVYSRPKEKKRMSEKTIWQKFASFATGQAEASPDDDGDTTSTPPAPTPTPAPQPVPVPPPSPTPSATLSAPVPDPRIAALEATVAALQQEKRDKEVAAFTSALSTKVEPGKQEAAVALYSHLLDADQTAPQKLIATFGAGEAQRKVEGSAALLMAFVEGLEDDPMLSEGKAATDQQIKALFGQKGATGEDELARYGKVAGLTDDQINAARNGH